MKMRSLTLALAAGLLGSLAFATPSHAGSLMVTTTVNVGSLFPSGTPKTLTEIDITYSGVSGITGLNGSNLQGGLKIPGYTPESATVTSVGTDEIKIVFAGPVSYVSGSYTFDTTTMGTPSISMVKTTPTGVVVKTAVTTAAVPEPTSMALLGIGMTSFLAFRRFFKRGSIA